MDVFGGDLAQPVTVYEEESPVPHRAPLAELQRDGAGVVEEPLHRSRARLPGPLDLLAGDRTGQHVLQRVGHGGGNFLLGSVVAQHGHRGERAGLAVLARLGRSGGGETGLHQRLVQTPRGLVSQYPGEQVDGREVLVVPRGHMVQVGDQFRVAGAAKCDHALAVLDRLGGVGGVDAHVAGAVGSGDGTELLDNQPQCLFGVELARNHELCVVGLVVLAIEGLKALDRNILEVRPGADGGVAVVVPQVGDGVHPLAQHPERAVFSRFPFIAHHRHLRLQVLRGDERIHHAVGLEVERPLEVVGGRREGLEVVGAIQPGGAIGERTPLGQFLGDVRVVGRALEHQVFEKMGHAGLAVAFVPRPDEVGDVHGGLGLAGIGEEKDPKSVVQTVFGDPLDGGDQGWLLGTGTAEGDEQGGKPQE